MAGERGPSDGPLATVTDTRLGTLSGEGESVTAACPQPRPPPVVGRGIRGEGALDEGDRCLVTTRDWSGSGMCSSLPPWGHSARMLVT